MRAKDTRHLPAVDMQGQGRRATHSEGQEWKGRDLVCGTGHLKNASTKVSQFFIIAVVAVDI